MASPPENSTFYYSRRSLLHRHALLHEGSGKQIEPSRLDSLKEDKDFIEATQKSTTDKANVLMRLKRAQELVIG
jgi:hypothetical protein